MRETLRTDRVGEIEWEITGRTDSSILYKGRRELERGDIDVFPANEGVKRGPKPKPWTSGAAVFWVLDFSIKQIYLEVGFLLRLLSRPVNDRRNIGIAFGAQKTPSNGTRSFEFFALKGEDRAAHPRNGELRIAFARGPNGWEAEYTQFLTNVDVRIHSDGSANAGCLFGLFRSASDVLWTVRILQGSYVHWPLVDAAAPGAPSS